MSDSLSAQRATLADLRARATTVRGRFLLLSTPHEAACLPRALAPRRITAAPMARRLIAPPCGSALRLALAFRQDLWRRLCHVRGLAPVTHVRMTGQGPEITLWACMLDGAAVSPVILDALQKMLEDAAVRRNRQWADRTLPRHK